MYFWWDLRFIDRGGVAWLSARLADSHRYSREVDYGEFATVDARLRAKYGPAHVAERFSAEPVELLRAVNCEAERIADFGLPVELLARTPSDRKRPKITSSMQEKWTLDLDQ